MESRLKISIIVPVFNAERYIRRSVGSALAQSLQEIEVICVNDGSSDGSQAILEELAAQDGRVRVVRRSNEGVSRARNAGMDIAKGKYIQFLDADDELAPGICEKLYAHAEEGDCDVVQCGHCEVVGEKVTRESPPNEGLTAANLLASPTIVHLQTKYIWDKLFRRDMLLSNGIRFAPYGYHEDHLFLFEVDLKARNLSSISDIGYRYSKSSDGAATRAYDERLLDCPRAYNDICTKAREAGIFDKVAPSIWRNSSQSYLWRIWAFRKYDNAELQRRIVEGWCEFFDANFPDWQKRLHQAGQPVVLPVHGNLKVLLLGGTGALGAHLRDLLAEAGHDVFVTSRSDHEDAGRIRYLKGNAMDLGFFNGLMQSRWDVIVDFMVHGPEGFRQRLPTLLDNCGQYVFLSSSRVYANAGEGLITEESPRLLDTVRDAEYLKTNEYALAKARAEDILKSCGRNNWTVIRPYITFSEQRLQLGTLEKEHWLRRALSGKPIVFSEDVASRTTTLTYGRDVARGMAALIGKPKALGQVFHITNRNQVRWRDVLDLYVRVIKEITGKDCPVVMTRTSCQLKLPGKYQVLYDRTYDRRFDNAKISRFIDVSTFRDTMSALEDCLRAFLVNPTFLRVNEALEKCHDDACAGSRPARYTVERNVQILIAALKAHGINQVIASPGTTNLTFVASMQHDPFFRIVSAPDERSAAYMACGWAGESGMPVVISCTGATASRNYLPGLTEAYYRKLPVLAVTGTLYENRSGHLTAQFIDRSQVPVDTVRLSVSMPLVRANDDEWHNTVAANRAILELTRHGGGPVHINLETGHDRDYSVEDLPPVRVIRRYFCGDALPDMPEGRVAVFAGPHGAWSSELTEAVDRFCERFDAPVFCDHTSNYRGRHGVDFTLACYQQSGTYVDYRPQTLIHIGEVSGDYPLLRICGGAKVWRVSADGEIRDAFRKLVNVFEMGEVDFFREYALRGAERRLDYRKTCLRHAAELLTRVPQLPFSNIWVASQGCKTIPDAAVLHFGILNSFRAWSLFGLPKGVLASCNTGGFGIDGCLSTTLGASLADPKRLHFVVLGDLAFFYDMNSLGNRFVGPNLRVLLVNNGKGVEFRNFNHPAAQFGEAADAYVAAGGHYGNKSRQLVRHYAQDLGFDYLSAATKDEYLKVAGTFWSAEPRQAPMVLEVFTDSTNDSDALELMTLIEGAWRQQAAVAPAKAVVPAKSGSPAVVKSGAVKANAAVKPGSVKAKAAPLRSRKIAILTFHTAFNCGAHLQAWALQEVLRRLGFEPEFPDCISTGFFSRFDDTWFKPYKKADSCGLLPKLRMELGALGVEDLKRYRFRMFAKRCLRIKPMEMTDVQRHYGAVMVGSDQVWNSGITRKESSYFLTTLFKNAWLKRYSYAISVGDKVPRPERIPVLAGAARLFENLSFRENLLPKLTDAHGKHPQVDPDPTLLLTKEDFNRIANPKGRIIRKPYLLVYSLQHNAGMWASVRLLAKEMGLKPVFILVYQYGYYRIADGKDVDIAVSPDRFLAYFRDAEAVVTSSFHGTVFSLMYEKPFAVLPNGSGKIPLRCVKLLESLHEQDHMVDSPQKLDALRVALASKPQQKTYEALARLRSATIRRLKSILPDVSALPKPEPWRNYPLPVWLVRKTFGGFKCLGENGLGYTVRHLWGKILRSQGVRSRL